MAQKNRTIRGIRDKIPPGYILGRTSSGSGAVELIPIAGNLAGLTAIGGGGGSGGGLSPALTSAHIFVGDATNHATDVAMSGDVAIDDTGATTVSKASGTGFNVEHYARIGSLSAPTNTTDGDLTAIRGFFGTQGVTLNTGKIFDGGYSPTTWPAGQSVAMAVGSTGGADTGGTTDARLLVFNNTITGSNGASVLSGAQGDGIWDSSGTLATGIGFSGSAQSIGGGTITGAYGVGGVIVSANAGSVITEGRALYARSPIASTGSITQAVGLRIETQKVGANVGKGYGVKQVSTADLNILAGRTTVGAASDPATSVALDVVSTTGAFRPPSMTTTQRNALTAANGMIVYDTTVNQFYAYQNGGWTPVIWATGGSAKSSAQFNVTITSQLTASFACQGNIMKPGANVTVTGAGFTMTTVTGGTYAVGIAPYDTGTNKITAAPAYSATYTESAGAAHTPAFLSFPTPVTMTAGTAYIVFLVRTDSTSSVSQTLDYSTGLQTAPGFYLPATGTLANLASLAPTTSDTWTVTGTGVRNISLTYQL